MTETFEVHDVDDGSDSALAATPSGDGRDQPFLWQRWNRERPESSRRARWLADARRAAGKAAGAVPEVWPLYREHDFAGLDPADDVELAADHVCIVLFAFHQQSETNAMHRQKVPFGVALRELRRSARFQGREDALDARVYAAATATSLAELQTHLRSVVALLKVEGIGFDYSALFHNLVEWQRPGGADNVRRRWGRDYYWQSDSKKSETSPKES